MRLASVIRRAARTSAALLVAAMLVVAGQAPASPPGQSNAYGKSLTEWMTLYMTWVLGGDQADHVGKVEFIPLPAEEPVSGSGTFEDPVLLAGEADVTLKPGSPFVLPVAVWFGEEYESGAVDPVLPAGVFTQSTVTVQVDGKTVMSSDRDDLEKFYVPPTDFDPEIVYPEPTSYGSVGAVFFQGLGFVHGPLSVGTHTITVVSEIKVFDPDLGLDLGIEYVNKWNVTVKK